MTTFTRRHMLSMGVAGGTSLALAGCGSTSSGSLQAKALPLSSRQATPLKLQIIIYNGFETLDALAPFDVFLMAQSFGANIQPSLVTIDHTSEVSTPKGLTVKTTGTFQTAGDILFIPGCGLDWDKFMPEGLAQILQQWHQQGKTIAADCTGAMLVAKAGLLRGRNANTHHRAVDALRKEGANIIDARVVDDGDILTSGGITSGIDLALWMVERYFGPAVALTVEQVMEYERRGVVWQREQK